MHAASVIMLCWAMIGAACFFSSGSAGVTAGILAVLVAVVGLPHGAADHRYARPRLEPVMGAAWLPVFLVGYMAIAAGVVWGWFVAPAATIVIFLLASAWHFGQEEPRLPVGPRWLRPVFQFARGGLVIWVPLVFHAGEVAAILSVATPGGSGPAGARATGLLTACSWIMLAIAAACAAAACAAVCAAASSASVAVGVIPTIERCHAAISSAVMSRVIPLLQIFISRPSED